MPVTVDLTGVSVGLEPLEPDIYPGVITKSEIHPSKSSNEDTLYLSLAIGEEGRELRWQSSLQPKALWRFKQLLVRLGFEIPEVEFEFDEADLVGIECRVRVTQEPHYQDPERMINRVAEILGSDAEGTESWG